MKSTARMKYQSIQMLRAIAALMVVIFHSKSAIWPTDERALLWWWPSFSDFGDLGVSLFFVISGFITANGTSKSDFSVWPYVWHRFWRIFPLYWIVMGAALLMYHYLNWFHADVESLGSGGMIKSFLIFPQKPFPFWAPGWSLEHEILFYIIAAAIVPFLGLPVLALVLIGLSVIGMSVVSFWDWHLFADPQLFFGAGVVGYILRNRRWYQALPVALILLGYSYAFYYKAFEAPYQIAQFAFAFGCAALIVTLLDFERHGWQVPKSLVLIGNASYSLYLWHWMVIPFAGWGRELWGGSPELWRWIIVVVSIVVALISYALFEKLFDAIGHGRLRAQRSFAPAE